MINPSIMKFKLIDKLLQTFGYAIINKNQNKAVNILSDHWNYFLGHIILYYIPLIVYFIILDYIPLIIEATILQKLHFILNPRTVSQVHMIK